MTEPGERSQPLPILALLAEILTTYFKIMIAGTVLAVIGLTGIIISFFLLSLIIIIVLKLLGILLNYVQAYLFLTQLIDHRI